MLKEYDNIEDDVVLIDTELGRYTQVQAHSELEDVIIPIVRDITRFLRRILGNSAPSQVLYASILAIILPILVRHSIISPIVENSLVLEKTMRHFSHGGRNPVYTLGMMCGWDMA